MANLTPNYGLKKPGQDDFYDIDDFNANADKLDAHKHTKNQITDFPESIKNPQSLNILLNGTAQGEYDGSVAKAINVTPGGIGAAPSLHEHPYLPLKGGTINGSIHLKGGYVDTEALGKDDFVYLEFLGGTVHIFGERFRTDVSSLDIGVGRMTAVECQPDSKGMFFKSDIIYERTYESGASIVAASNCILGRLTSSSKRYKTDIVYLSHPENSTVVEKNKLSRARSKSVINPSAILNIPIVTFKYNEGYVTGGDYKGEPILGFIAEDVEKVFPEAVTYSIGYKDSITGKKYSDEELREISKTEPNIIERCKEFKDFDNPEAWNANVMIPAMLKVIQDLHTDLENEKKQRLTIEERLGAVEALLSGNKS